MFRLPFRHALAAAVPGLLALTLLPANPSHAALPYLEPADCISGRYLALCYSDFQEGLAAVAGVKADGSGLGYGYIDPHGQMVIAPQFMAAGAFSNGLAAVESYDETWGISTQPVPGSSSQRSPTRMPSAAPAWLRCGWPTSVMH